MRVPAAKGWLQLSAGTLLYLGAAFSLGWYYTFTYYGRSGYPMPLIDACGGILIYYFSVLNIATPWQAVHWMMAFPLAGAIWAACCNAACRVVGDERPAFAHVFFLFAVAAIPIAIAGPFMAWIAGLLADGFSWDHMIKVALRRANKPPPEWLSPLYLALGFAGLVIQLVAYSRLYTPPLTRGAKHLGLSAILHVVACVLLAMAAAIPLRLLLE